VARKRDLTTRGVERLSKRERSAGLDPEDDAARWLAEHDPPAPPPVPKRSGKSKTLHRWKRRSV
jgi:Ser/Thr protein kinase RdoA (MazF antagonist)